MLTNLDTLLVQASFDQTDAAKLKVGAAATVTPQGVTGASAISATVEEIDPTSTTSNNVVNYGVTLALVKRAAGLKTGETVSVSVITGEANNAIYVPATAVTTTGTTSTVVVVGKNNAQSDHAGHPGRPGQHQRPDPHRAHRGAEGADVDGDHQHRRAASPAAGSASAAASAAALAAAAPAGRWLTASGHCRWPAARTRWAGRTR